MITVVGVVQEGKVTTVVSERYKGVSVAQESCNTSARTRGINISSKDTSPGRKKEKLQGGVRTAEAVLCD